MLKVETICDRIISEANICKEYSEEIVNCLENPVTAKDADLLDDLRIDSVNHLQKLVEILIDSFYEDAPKNEEMEE